MTVIAYCSVSADGRTFDGQIVLSDSADAKKRLRPVTDACHRHGAAVCAQLTHAGSFAHRHVIHTQQVSASAVFNIALNVVLIPLYSWQGAAAATIATEVLLAGLHWCSLRELAAQDVRFSNMPLPPPRESIPSN